MAMPTEYYVDPAIAADSGTGTVGDPYGDLQYALNSVTRNSTGGDRFNIKAGTDEILTAALDLTSYGTPAAAGPLLFQGYTSTQGDGGIGGISGNGSYSVMNNSTVDYIVWADLHLHNSGANDIINIDRYNVFYNVEFDNTTLDGCDTNQYSHVISCYFHNIGQYGANVSSACHISQCTFKNGPTNDFLVAAIVGIGASVSRCIFDIDGSTTAIDSDDASTIVNNSIYSSSGTGVGIRANDQFQVVYNNIVEGFSGVGGVGIQRNTGSLAWSLVGYNAFYNNTTDVSTEILVDLTSSDQSLGASPFADAGSDDFTVDATVKALGLLTANYPGVSVRSHYDIGALQREEPAGGGSPLGNTIQAVRSGLNYWG